MRRWFMLAALALLGGCAGQSESRFDFVAGDGRRVTSAAGATGETSRAGYLTVEDGQWSLVMSLQGVSPGSHAVSPEVGVVLVLDKGRGVTYTTSPGGMCAVWIDPHGSADGSPVAGNFSCSGLRSAEGDQLDITSGYFEVPLNDAANPTRK